MKADRTLWGLQPPKRPRRPEPPSRSRERRFLAPFIAAAALLTACETGPELEELARVTLVTEGGSTPTVSIDPEDGSALVAWVGTRAGEANVYLARVATDGRMGEPVRVNDLPGDASPHDQAPAQVRIGPERNVYVAWQNRTDVEWLDFGASDVRLARSTDGGRSFEPAITVTDGADAAHARQTFHDLAVGPDGTVYVSWIDARERDRFRRDRYLREQADGPSRLLASPADRGAEPEGATGSIPRTAPGLDADPVSDREPGTDIRIARSTDGGRTFLPGIVADTESCPCCRTAIAVGESGEVYVAWRKIHDGEVRDVVVARSDDGGGSFAPPVRPREDGWVFPGCPHAGPSLAVDAEGTVHLAWYTGREGEPGVYLAASVDGRNFGPATEVMTGDWVPASQLKLATDGPRVWIVWDDRRHDNVETRLAMVDPVVAGPTSTRTRRRPLRAFFSVSGLSPSVAALNGTVAMTWLEDEAVHLALWRVR